MDRTTSTNGHAVLDPPVNGQAGDAPDSGRARYIQKEDAVSRLISEIAADDVEEVVEHEVRVVRLASPKKLEVHLTPNERRILACLRQHAECVVSYEVISRALYGPIFDAQRDISAIQVYMSNLRAKLEPHPRSPRYLINYPGVGYALYPNGLEVPELSVGAAFALGTSRPLAMLPTGEVVAQPVA